MRFTKMEGLGNDYIYLNCLSRRPPDPAGLAVRLSDRHFGVGADGLICVCPGRRGDFAMEMYNADGSRGKMCGNGVRCIAKYVYDHHLTDKTRISLETLAGIKYLDLNIKKGKVETVTVDMGAPILEPAKIPVNISKPKAVNEPVEIDGKIWHMTCVSMGNPHAVVFVDDTHSLKLNEIGPLFEKHPLFPEQVNTEFVHVIDRHTVDMRVWERGSGETLACGTGACASAVAAILCGRCKEGEDIVVKLRGGDLTIRVEGSRVWMTGEAVTVFEGTVTV